MGGMLGTSGTLISVVDEPLTGSAGAGETLEVLAGVEDDSSAVSARVKRVNRYIA